MADFTSGADGVLRRAMEANVRYYQALGDVTQAYWKAMFSIMREMPARIEGIGIPKVAAWRPGSASGAVRTAEGHGTSVEPGASAQSATALVLEAAAGAEARGVFAVENHLGRQVSTAVVTSAFAHPTGRAVQPAIRVQPAVVTLDPGGRTLVQVFVTIPAEMEADVIHRGEIDVPGLSTQGIPVVLRRLAAAPADSEGIGPTGSEAESSAGNTPQKSPRRKRSRKS